MRSKAAHILERFATAVLKSLATFEEGPCVFPGWASICPSLRPRNPLDARLQQRSPLCAHSGVGKPVGKPKAVTPGCHCCPEDPGLPDGHLSSPLDFSQGDKHKGFWRREWQPTPVLLPGESHGQRGLEGYCPWGHKELDTSECKAFVGGFPSFSAENPPAMQEMQEMGIQPLEEKLAAHSHILAWEIPWTEDPGSYSPWGRRVRHD